MKTMSYEDYVSRMTHAKTSVWQKDKDFIVSYENHNMFQKKKYVLALFFLKIIPFL